MPLIPRVIVSFVVALIAFIGLIHFENWPPEVYTPPPMLYQNATKEVRGDVTGTEAKGLGDHIFEGADTYYYVDYEFHPYVYTAGKRVGISPTLYTGAVKIVQQDYNSAVKGDTIVVKYDPIDPNINGVPGTLGVWSTKTGYLNSYVWYYVGVFILGLILQEALRMITRTNDFR